MPNKKNYTDIVLNSLPQREMEIVGSITAERMNELRSKAVAKIKENIEIAGFRKGNAPDALIVQKVGEMSVLEETAEMALSEEYPNILDEHSIDAIGRPEISITKMAPGNELSFKIKTYLAPLITLAEYKKIAQTENKKVSTKTPDVTDAEIDEVLLNIRKNIAHQEIHAKHSSDEHTHDHPEITDADLPEVTDEFAQKIGGFKTVVELKEKIKENIASEKTLKDRDKHRTHLLEEIIEKSTIELPQIIVDGEMEKMLAQFKDDLTRSGVSYEDYLKHIKKTEEDLKNEWKETALKRAKSQVVLNEIARAEKLEPAEEDVKKEMEHIIEHYKDAERFRVRMYVETFMTNELVLSFLESQNK